MQFCQNQYCQGFFVCVGYKFLVHSDQIQILTSDSSTLTALKPKVRMLLKVGQPCHLNLYLLLACVCIYWQPGLFTLGADFLNFWIQISCKFEFRFHAEGSWRVYCSSPRSSWLSEKIHITDVNSLLGRNMSWKILGREFRSTFSSIQRRQSGGMAVKGGQWANENIISAVQCLMYCSVQCLM